MVELHVDVPKKVSNFKYMKKREREREREHGMRHDLCIWNIIMTEYDPMCVLRINTHKHMGCFRLFPTHTLTHRHLSLNMCNYMTIFNPFLSSVSEGM